MLYWIIYDITENRIRLKISELCKNYGMHRVQKSAFLGDLTKNKAEMLAIEAKEIIPPDSEDAMFIMPACTQCYKSKMIIGKLDENYLKKVGYTLVGYDES